MQPLFRLDLMNMMRLLRFVSIGFFVLTSFLSSAQYTIIGQNSFAGTNVYGPMTSDVNDNQAFSRHAYIYPVAALGVLQHGDSIRSVEYFKSSNNGFRGTPNFKIFLNNSTAADFGPGNIHWPDRSTRTGAQKVFDSNPSSIAGTTTGWKKFEFIQPYFYDTTRGHNLEILTEFTQDSAQNAVISWVYENDFTVPQFVSNDETKFVFNAGSPRDSTISRNVRKPYIKINFFRYSENLECTIIYGLGQVPVLMLAPDTIRARMQNVGLDTVKNKKAFLLVTGANNHLDSVSLPDLAPHEEIMVEFPNHQPDTSGRETLSVFVGKDDYAADDTASMDRAVNYNVYSHADPFSGIAGGIGFNGSSGDFVARFYSDSVRYINQVKVDFSIGNRPFQVGIWEDSSGMPGKNIYTSDTLTSVAGTYVLALLPRIKIDGSFYVGIRQTGTVNVAFGFQWEIPIRPDAFFFAAPLGSSDWTPFDPGFNYRFNIQPRIQVANDVGILSLDYPGQGDTIEYNQFDSIRPSVSLINYGFNDQKAPFDVFYQIIDRQGQTVYSDFKTVTIKANDTLKVTFDKKFSLNNLGTFTVRAFSKLFSDRIVDNDTLGGTFDIVIRYDLAAERFFSPDQGTTYEMNRDSVWPVVRVLNNGVIDQSNVNVTFQLLRGDTQVFHTQTKQVDMPGRQSVIIDFDTVTFPVDGTIYFRAIVSGGIDSFPINDTVTIFVFVEKGNDIGITRIRRPAQSSRYEVNQRFQPFIDLRNYGRRDQDSFYIVSEIFRDGNLQYRDSNLLDLIKFSSTQSIFKFFDVQDTPGIYLFRARVIFPEDQDPSNDTLESIFRVVRSNDLAVVSIRSPEDSRLYYVGDTLTFEVDVANYGLSAKTDSALLVCFLNSANTSPVYLDSMKFSTNITPDSSISVLLPSRHVLLEKSNFSTQCYLKWTPDEEPNNDTLGNSFNGTYPFSLSIDLEEPEANAEYQMKVDLIEPRMVLINDGVQDIVDSTLLSYHMSYAGEEAYTYRVKIGPIAVNERVSHDVSPGYVLADSGRYAISAHLENSVDLFRGDDSVSIWIESVKDHDISAERFVYPKSTDTAYYNLTIAPRGLFQNVGRMDENADLRFEIEKDGELLFRSDKNYFIESGASIVAAFDSVYYPRSVGYFNTKLIARLGTDQDSRNDTIQSGFMVVHGVGIQEIRDPGVRISPIPASDFLNIQFEATAERVIKLIDIRGAVVIQERTPNRFVRLTTSDLAQGTYLLSIDDGKSIFERKVILK